MWRIVICVRVQICPQLQAVPPQTKSTDGEGVGGTNGKETCTLQANCPRESTLDKAVEENSGLPQNLVSQPLESGKTKRLATMFLQRPLPTKQDIIKSPYSFSQNQQLRMNLEQKVNKIPGMSSKHKVKKSKMHFLVY